MPSAVADRPVAAELQRLCVGRPVSAMHAKHWEEILSFLRAHRVAPVTALRLPERATGVTTSCVVAYKRTPGIQCVLVEVEMHEASNARALVTVSMGGSTYVDNPSFLDGSRNLDAPPTGQRSRSTHRVILGVTGITAGTITTMSITHADGSPAGSKGIRRVTVTEIPLISVDPIGDAAEPGVDGNWPFSQNEIYDGAGDSVHDGYLRFWSEMKKARKDTCRHWQIHAHEDTTGSMKRTGTTMGALTYQLRAVGSNPPVYRIRPRRLYDSATPNVATFWTWYFTGSASNGGKLRAIVTPVGGSPANTDLTLAGRTTFGAASTSINLPLTGTGQEIDVQFEAQPDHVDNPLHFATIGFFENES